MELKKEDRVRLKNNLSKRVLIVKHIYAKNELINSNKGFSIEGDVRLVYEDDENEGTTVHKTQLEIIK